MDINHHDIPDQLTGSCLCGAVHYTVPVKPLLSALCYGASCHARSELGVSGVVVIPRSTIPVAGETAVFEALGASGLRVSNRYCPQCDTPLTTEPDVAPEVTMVAIGSVHNNHWFQPDVELFESNQTVGRTATKPSPK